MLTLVSLYSVILAFYLISQLVYAEKERRLQNSVATKQLSEYPFVSIVIPHYNESFEAMRDTIASCLNAEYPADRFEVIAVDDGNKSPAVHEKLVYTFFKEIDAGRCKIVRLDKNVGKRHAQCAGVEIANINADYFLTVDSDSVIQPDAITNIVKIARLNDCKAVTGVSLVKPKPTLLNALLRVRYWVANLQERMAYSYFSQISCCSGPLSLYDAQVFRRVSHDYTHQFFLGQQCTYGDDRHLTNLFLREGSRIKAAQAAICHTATPDTWRQWMKQQLRWSKSFYRETYWAFRNIRQRLGWFYTFHNTMAIILPVMVLSQVGIYTCVCLWHLWAGTPIDFLPAIKFVIATLLAGFVRGAYAFWLTRDLTYFLSPIYGVVHFFIVFPVRIYALFRMKDTKWGTR